MTGKEYPPVDFTIEAERVAAFAKALGLEVGDGVPPTFAAVYSLGAAAPYLFGDPEAAINFAKLLHAEQEFEWTRHPTVGETVTSRGRIASDTERRGMRFVGYEVETTGSDGAPLCRSRALFVIRA